MSGDADHAGDDACRELFTATEQAKVGVADQYGQILDVYVSPQRDLRAARRFFASAFTAHGEPGEIVTDKAPALARSARARAGRVP